MDLNQSMEFTSSSSSTPSSPQFHNFMQMPSFILPHPHYMNLITPKQVQRQNLEVFWNQQMFDIHNISAFKSHYQLPLARIKRIMKSDRDVKMISGDTPILFSKACEMFILELTLRAWLQTEVGNRRILQRCDVAKAIRLDEVLDFLVESVPLDEHQVEENDSDKTESFHTSDHLFPMTNSNRELDMMNQDVSQPFMITSSMSSTEFNYESSFE